MLTFDIPVRWGDLDAFNHVNNTVILRYIEEARVKFLGGTKRVNTPQYSGPMVVNINCNFRRQIGYPETVRVSLQAHQASEKRLVMSHRITSVDDPEILYADAEVTAVWVDNHTGKSIPLPGGVRDALGLQKRC